ncbi:MAG: rod shape-determining protein [Lachnospiraceae bacterium]|nr:rod shape-determining protein [Lachnospiraceae bacterium]
MNNPDNMVFGLDIGTRSIVGTVGYKDRGDTFRVVAQVVKEHNTRAMMDGQIHDISKVAESIGVVKRELEHKIGGRLKDVCIAAAGRVLKTITVSADYEFTEETKVTDEHIYSLDLIGVENAYEEIRKDAGEDENYYCVGYSVIRYFLNGSPITNLEGHKANKISTELIATFLPDEVVDGLYAAVERAGLYVANLTLEPIAAINVAIPERFRLLNIALVDVGAGTSDICITKDGSIIAYGMIPLAGDELTEQIAKEYLTEFSVAEKIKLACFKRKTVSYTDIMGIKHKLNTADILAKLDSNIRNITKNVADKIIELNGDKAVSAVFIVGGGGKIPGFSKTLAEYLSLADERVAIRGEEVLGFVEFEEENIKKDSLLVTPIGICLNYYEQKNNFIFVTINGERVKLYDNNKLTIIDAAIQIGIQNDLLFPQRGDALNFTVNKKPKFVRGKQGEAAVVTLNGKPAGINSTIEANDVIEVTYSTKGEPATMDVGQLPEYNNSTITFMFNDRSVTCPKFVKVNGELVSNYYAIKENDQIEILNYYTLAQVLEFMDLTPEGKFYVNHVEAGLEEKIYENFTIHSKKAGKEESLFITPEAFEEKVSSDDEEDITETAVETEDAEVKTEPKASKKPYDISVTVNSMPILLQGKAGYIFVDILDVYPFDVSEGADKTLVKQINEMDAEFTSPIKEGDVIKLYWEEHNK